MTKDKQGKTRGFIKGGIILWVLTIILYIIMNFIGNNGTIDAPKDSYQVIDQYSTIVLIFGVFGIPVLLGLSIFLRSFEKILDKIAQRFQRD
jgi:hypothetical protein